MISGWLQRLAFPNLLQSVAWISASQHWLHSGPVQHSLLEIDIPDHWRAGGVSAAGGVGKAAGAVIGALLMAVMNNGMSILGIGIDYQQIGHRADACRVH